MVSINSYIFPVYLFYLFFYFSLSLTDSRVLTLDRNSAYRFLSISEEDRRVSSSSMELYYSSHSDRFTSLRQVLCREGLSERCYWEVWWSGGTWEVAVACKDISKSWSLQCSPKGYTYKYNYKKLYF